MIVGVGCWRGSGATTTALLLAAALAEVGAAPWLVEADAAGGVLATRCGLRADELGGRDGIGVELLARRRGSDADDADDEFGRAAVSIGDVALVPMPADPFRAHGCLSARSSWIDLLPTLVEPVVIDVGRFRPGAVPWSVLDRLDVLLVVTSAEATALVAGDDWLENGGRMTAADTGLAADIGRLVVVDAPVAGTTFSEATATAELGDRLAGWIPWSPSAVELLHCGAGLSDRRAGRRGFAAAARRLAANVTALSDVPRSTDRVVNA